MFSSKKAYIHHPLGAGIVAFILGMLVMYLIAKGTIPIPFKVC